MQIEELKIPILVNPVPLTLSIPTEEICLQASISWEKKESNEKVAIILIYLPICCQRSKWPRILSVQRGRWWSPQLKQLSSNLEIRISLGEGLKSPQVNPLSLSDHLMIKVVSLLLMEGYHLMSLRAQWRIGGRPKAAGVREIHLELERSRLIMASRATLWIQVIWWIWCLTMESISLRFRKGLLQVRFSPYLALKPNRCLRGWGEIVRLGRSKGRMI